MGDEKNPLLDALERNRILREEADKSIQTDFEGLFPEREALKVNPEPINAAIRKLAGVERNAVRLSQIDTQGKVDALIQSALASTPGAVFQAFAGTDIGAAENLNANTQGLLTGIADAKSEVNKAKLAADRAEAAGEVQIAEQTEKARVANEKAEAEAKALQAQDARDKKKLRDEEVDALLDGAIELRKEGRADEAFELEKKAKELDIVRTRAQIKTEGLRQTDLEEKNKRQRIESGDFSAATFEDLFNISLQNEAQIDSIEEQLDAYEAALAIADSTDPSVTPEQKAQANATIATFLKSADSLTKIAVLKDAEQSRVRTALAQRAHEASAPQVTFMLSQAEESQDEEMIDLLLPTAVEKFGAMTKEELETVMVQARRAGKAVVFKTAAEVYMRKGYVEQTNITITPR